ncbi:MAG: hypothetical protein IPI74_03475 [Bacteroidales bacterium]|nr:hypothetical protein [Bacteroidales bacterium]
MPALCIHERGTAKSFRDEAISSPEVAKSDRRAVRQFYFHTSRRGHHLGMLAFTICRTVARSGSRWDTVTGLSTGIRCLTGV